MSSDASAHSPLPRLVPQPSTGLNTSLSFHHHRSRQQAMWGVQSQQQQQQQSRRPSPLRMQAAPEAATDGAPKLSPKQERRRIIQSPNFHRQVGFSNGEKEGAESLMVSEFTGQLINEMKDRTYTYQKGDLTIKLAKSFGFCWGVERAVAMAYEARAHFPDRVSQLLRRSVTAVPSLLFSQAAGGCGDWFRRWGLLLLLLLLLLLPPPPDSQSVGRHPNFSISISCDRSSQPTTDTTENPHHERDHPQPGRQRAPGRHEDRLCARYVCGQRRCAGRFLAG